MATYIDESQYQLKYRWTGKDSLKKDVRLDILQKSESAFTLTQIGGLQALVLNVQGGQESITAPIIKTSLQITLIDAPDEVAAGYKYGNWEEFFTPDATRYLVKLYRCWRTDTLELEWQGYITPDSWQESLDYRGAITITARDNIGHLQDFSFDAAPANAGLRQIYNGTDGLLDLALAKISYPLTLTHNTAGDARSLRDTAGNLLINSWVNVSKYKDSNWYSAIETLLEAIGYCLRFVGGGIVLQPVRGLPLLGYTSRSTAHAAAHEVEFYGGNRSNDPAYREIKETVNFDAQSEVDYDLRQNLVYGVTYTTYQGRQYKPRNQSWDNFTGRSCRNVSLLGQTQGGWLNGGGFLNPADCNIQSTLEAEDGAKAMELGIALPADQTTAGTVVPYFRIPACSTDITVRCEFARPVELKNDSGPYTVARLKDYMAKAVLCIKYTDPLSHAVYFWTGSGWQTEDCTFEADIAEVIAESYAFEVALSDISATAALGGWLDIGFANFLNYGEDAPDYGSFVRLTGIKSIINAKSVLKSDTVTTINSADYNVKVLRRPEVGAMSALVPYVSPANYPGALWTFDANGKPVPYGYAVYYNGFSSGTAIPLPAQIHKQILCFYHVSLRILEGQMGSLAKASPLSFAHEILYKSHYYIIQGGALDVLHNRINGVTMHEYIWYDSLWDEASNPEYSGVPVYETNSASGNVNGTGSSSGGSSGGGGGGGGGTGTVTSVGVSVPAGFSTSGSPVTRAGTISISYAQGYALPLAADTAKGVTAYGWGDHRQAGYLTQTSISEELQELSRFAPRLRIYRGFIESAGQQPVAPFLRVEHPLQEFSGVTAECVLMQYRKRRGRKGATSTKRGPTYTDGWGEVRGKHATTAPLTWAKDVTLDSIRQVVLNRCVCGSGVTEEAMEAMTLATFRAYTLSAKKFGFGGKHSQAAATFVAKHSRLFGVALRYENPDWAANVTGTVAETTREVEDANHHKVKRYIYTEIVPVRIYCNPGQNDGWELGIELYPR